MIRKLISILYRTPFKAPYFLASHIICKVRSLYYSSKIDSGGGKITITEPFMKINILKSSNAKLNISGELKIVPHEGGNTPVFIRMASNSTISINGDFVIGNGVRICLSPNSEIIFGGKDIESECGITADTLIMVFKKISIGNDFVCSWNVFITDSDWHYIDGQDYNSDVVIGNHVWVANNSNILKGTCIGNNCIIASCTKIANKHYNNNLLIGGVPSKILKEDIDWSSTRQK
jgi:acetyltransferase-like isoleucine patch superfamily enzyme